MISSISATISVMLISLSQVLSAPAPSLLGGLLGNRNGYPENYQNYGPSGYGQGYGGPGGFGQGYGGPGSFGQGYGGPGAYGQGYGGNGGLLGIGLGAGVGLSL